MLQVSIGSIEGDASGVMNLKVVSSTLTRCTPHGGIAQLVERLLCKQEVSGSNPLASTPKFLSLKIWYAMVVGEQRLRWSTTGKPEFGGRDVA